MPRGVEHDLAERVPPHLEHLRPPDRLPPRALLLLQSGGVLSVLFDGLVDDVHPVLAARVLVVGVQNELFLAAGQLEKKFQLNQPVFGIFRAMRLFTYLEHALPHEGRHRRCFQGQKKAALQGVGLRQHQATLQ